MTAIDFAAFVDELATVSGDRTLKMWDVASGRSDIVSVLGEHRPARLRGRALGEVLSNPELEPRALLDRFSAWESDPGAMVHAPPTVAFAVLGQARASGRLSPEREGRILRRLIRSWAVRSSLETARATTRSATDMFVGQPTIWAGP